MTSPTTGSTGDVRDRHDQANTPSVVVAAMVTMLFWASSFVVIRGVGEAFGPFSMALLRMAAGSVVLTVIVLVTGIRIPPRRTWPTVAAWGIAWFAVYTVALNAAEHTIDAGTAAMLVNVAPLLVVLLGGLTGEGFPRPLLLGAPISFLGVVLIGTASATGHHASTTGVLLALLAASLYAGGTIVQKRLLHAGVDPTTLTWLGVLAGTASLLPWTGDLARDLHAAPLPATLGVVYMGCFPTAVAFLTWAYVLGRSTAGRTASTSYLVPAIAIGLSFAFLGETPTPAMLLGGVLCLAGVAITRLRPRRRA